MAGMGVRIATAVLTGVAGVVFGILGTLTHSSRVAIGAAQLPWGIVVALAAVACLLLGVRLLVEGRLAVITAAVGVVIPVAVFAQPSFGGSVLVENDALGWVWILGSAFLALIVAGWPRVRVRARQA